MKIHLKADLNAQRKHKQHAPIRRCGLSLLIVLIPISLRKLSANIEYDYFKIYQELCMPGTFVHCAHSSNINKLSHVSGGVSACCHDSSRANCGCNEDSTLICWAGPAAATVYDKNTDNQ